MDKEEINSAFIHRWQTMVENSDLPLRAVKEAREMCYDFFTAGINLANIPLNFCPNPTAETEEDIENDFEIWWKIYDTKRGKPMARRKWHSMSVKERMECYEGTYAYVKATEKKLRLHPHTYLNQKPWRKYTSSH